MGLNLKEQQANNEETAIREKLKWNNFNGVLFFHLFCIIMKFISFQIENRFKINIDNQFFEIIYQ